MFESERASLGVTKKLNLYFNGCTPSVENYFGVVAHGVTERMKHADDITARSTTSVGLLKWNKACLCSALFFPLWLRFVLWAGNLTFVSLLTDSLCQSAGDRGRGRRSADLWCGALITWLAKITKWSDSALCLHTVKRFGSQKRRKILCFLYSYNDHHCEKECGITYFVIWLNKQFIHNVMWI